jgi:hypothetical protein
MALKKSNTPRFVVTPKSYDNLATGQNKYNIMMKNNLSGRVLLRKSAHLTSFSFILIVTSSLINVSFFVIESN